MKKPAQLNRERHKGAAIAEFGAAIALVIPMILMLVYLCLQGVRAYMIQCSLKEAATVAARRVALQYGQNPLATLKDPDWLFDQIIIGDMVVSPEQFAIQPGDWSLKGRPPTVTVTVTYVGGLYGCPPFPNPNLFHIRPITFVGRATQQLE